LCCCATASLGGCASQPAVQRFALHAAKPDSCELTWQPALSDALARDYELIGVVTVYGDEAETLGAKSREEVRLWACRLGGDVIAFGSSSPGGTRISGSTSFHVMSRRVEAPPSRTEL